MSINHQDTESDERFSLNTKNIREVQLLFGLLEKRIVQIQSYDESDSYSF